jgi:ribosomal protein S12 methylthiotransferase accessory factor
VLDLGGTYRALSPEETLAKIEPLLSRVGITRIANITGLDNIGIPTYMAIRPMSKSLTTAQGKGITHELAKISAIMECIECWHAENLPAPDLVGSYHDLHHQYALLPLDSQINRDVFLAYTLPELNLLEMPWLRATELFSGKEIYIPYQLVNMDFAYRQGLQQFFIYSTTNGLASGNTYEEALCHGLYELIERDCESEFVIRPNIDVQKIDPATIRAPHLIELMTRLNYKEVKLDLYDMTNDMQIPAYMAYLHDLTGVRLGGIYRGAGCHFSDVVALSRAITEAIQSRLTIISGTRDDAYPLTYKSLQKDTLGLNAQAFESFTPKPFVEKSVPNGFANCIDELLSRIKRRGLEQVIVYDHTKKEFDISVLHTIVPGLKMTNSLHAHTGYSHCDL